MRFEDLCGIHMFSGVELTEEFRKDLFFGEGSVSVCLFTLDGVTYHNRIKQLNNYVQAKARSNL